MHRWGQPRSTARPAGRPGFILSFILNLSSAALVLPGFLLAMFVANVHYVAAHGVGGTFEAIWAWLDWLPDPQDAWLWTGIALAVATAALVIAVRVPWLFPFLVLAAGSASMAYIAWLTSGGPPDSPLIYFVSGLGILLSALQLWRIRGAAG